MRRSGGWGWEGGRTGESARRGKVLEEWSGAGGKREGVGGRGVRRGHVSCVDRTELGVGVAGGVSVSH